MVMDNDTRGWVLTCISAIACVLGAAVIYVDLLIRLLPGQKGFKIQDSDGFLSCSLSLSAGVMLFSALYKMLPSSKEALHNGGLSPKAAEWTLIGCFLLGVFGIQILSNIIHRFMPSHVVDCEHTHEEEESNHNHPPNHHHDHENHNHEHSHAPSHEHSHEHKQNANGHGVTEQSPLLVRSGSIDGTVTGHFAPREMSDVSRTSPMPLGAYSKQLSAVRPSLQSRMSSSVKLIVSGSKLSCDGDGPCYGYSDPCGQECFRNINSRGGTRSALPGHSRPTTLRHANTSSVVETPRIRSLEALRSIDEEASIGSRSKPRQQRKWSMPNSVSAPATSSTNHSRPHSTHSISATSANSQHDDDEADDDADHGPQPAHHHHVPQNAFLSLSLQTSIAIALHKLPEGFITYATNHANPSLGFTVFLALAIHNISEGFALALPLFLATQSRLKALLYSLVLGGLSQPLGAGVAAAWLKIAERGRGEWTPGERVYGGMFAATAGIMASVALSLLQESLELSHRKGLCMAFAFVGMGVLGVSSALTA